jgi:hypothetical protein
MENGTEVRALEIFINGFYTFIKDREIILDVNGDFIYIIRVKLFVSFVSSLRVLREPLTV